MLTANKPKSRIITGVEKKDNALYLRSEYGLTVLIPKTENIIRVITTPADRISDNDNPGVICSDVYEDWDYTELENEIRMTLPAMEVTVGKKDGALSYLDREGHVLFKERSRDPKEFEEFEMFALSADKVKTRTLQTADGQKQVLEEPEKIPAGKSCHIRFNFELGDEALYGLGQQEKGFASLRGKTIYLHQANRRIPIPMFVSTKGYGILADSYSPMIFNDNEQGTYLYIEADKELDYYFIAGDMETAVKGYRTITGKAALLPRWAFGYVQSQERFESQEEIIKTVDRSRELGIGMDCMVLDWMSWPDGQWGQKSYDEIRFPDPVAMIDELHKKHVHLMISVWPNMTETTEDYKEFAARKLLLPASNTYDALNEEARKLYFDQLKKTHFAYGTDAWWCDSSEPFTPEWNHPMRLTPGENFREFCEEAGLRIPYEYCNSYPFFHAMGIYENQRRAMEEGRNSAGPDESPDAIGSSGTRCEKRVCNLTRAAYTGQQRFGTIMWSGDTDASWDTYKDQIAIGLHFSASGLPWWTMDTGAFFVKRGDYWYWNGRYDDTADNKGFCELYTRWYQYAAFLPMFRAHGTDVRREMWTFDGIFYDAMLAANRLRYRLMPYIYSEAGKVWLMDRSLIRWLAFDFTEDKKTWNITDQFMFGESLMVCPVTEPMYYGEDGNPLGTSSGDENDKTREVYFPAGCDWYDFYTGQVYRGGTATAVCADLDKIPLFVKAGSLIPLKAPALSTEELTGEIEWKKFGDGEASYELYEDAGDGYAYERGEYTLKTVTM